jgi:homeobox-leucine zipper protein
LSDHNVQLFFKLQDAPTTTRTLDLASTLEVGSGGARPTNEISNAHNMRSVLTIAFQFTYEDHLRENVAMMARNYVRSVAASVQRVAMAISPSLGAQIGMKHAPGSPEAHTLARWISRSYR